MTTTTVIHSRTETLNPLTTIFTPPSACSTFYYTYDGEIDGTTYALREVGTPGLGASSSCYPPNYAVHHYSANLGHYGYSPAVCPSSYSAFAISTVSSRFYSICCPPSMRWGLSYCTEHITNPSVISYTNSSLGVATSFVAQQWPIFAVWASSDLSLFHPKSAPLLEAGSTITLSTPAATSNPPSSPSTAPAQKSTGTTSSSLSTGAQIGIGVGVGVGALLVIIALVVFFLARRQRRQRNAGATPAPASDVSTENTWSSEDAKTRGVYQLHSDSALSEADSRQQPAELPGDWEGRGIR